MSPLTRKPIAVAHDLVCFFLALRKLLIDFSPQPGGTSDNRRNIAEKQAPALPQLAGIECHGGSGAEEEQDRWDLFHFFSSATT